MTVAELIEALSELPPTLQVYAWIDGDRERVNSVDDSFIADGFIDINAGAQP